MENKNVLVKDILVNAVKRYKMLSFSSSDVKEKFNISLTAFNNIIKDLKKDGLNVFTIYDKPDGLSKKIKAIKVLTEQKLELRDVYKNRFEIKSIKDI